MLLRREQGLLRARQELSHLVDEPAHAEQRSVRRPVLVAVLRASSSCTFANCSVAESSWGGSASPACSARCLRMRFASPCIVTTCRPESEAGSRCSSAARAASRAADDPTTSATRSGSAPPSTSRANRSRSTAVLPVPAGPVTSSVPEAWSSTSAWRSSGEKGAVTKRMLPPLTDSPP